MCAASRETESVAPVSAVGVKVRVNVEEEAALAGEGCTKLARRRKLPGGEGKMVQGTHVNFRVRYSECVGRLMSEQLGK